MAVKKESSFEEEKENTFNTNTKGVTLPWQFSTPGMILGLVLGVIPLVLALVGNFQIKQGYKVDELLKAYNIILILAAVLIAIVIFMWFIAVIFSYSSPYGFSSY